MEQQIQKKVTVNSLFDTKAVKDRLIEILQSSKRASTFATSVIQIMNNNKALADCDPTSVVGAAMTSATLELPLNNSLGYAYIIPFNEKQGDGTWLKKAQFQIGYKGFIQLAMRSGQFKTIHATDVKQGEIITRERLSGEIDFQWIEDESQREKTSTIGYVAYFRLLNSYEATLFMTMEELSKHGKKFSKTFDKSFGLWNTDMDSMSKKTVLKLLLSKFAPLSIEMQTAVKTDQASFNDVENTEDISYIDNEPTIELDHDAERIILLIESSKNQEELDFAKSHANEEHLPLIKKKQKELNDSKKPTK